MRSERNAASYGLFVIFMLIPVCPLPQAPVQDVCLRDDRLGDVRRRLQHRRICTSTIYSRFCVRLFKRSIEGAIVYGVCAVGSWVAECFCTRASIPSRRAAAARDVQSTHHR